MASDRFLGAAPMPVGHASGIAIEHTFITQGTSVHGLLLESPMTPRIEAPTGRGIRMAMHAYPAPEDAPRPRITPIGGGKYRCKSGIYEGFGSTPVYAWNAWVSRLTSIRFLKA